MANGPDVLFPTAFWIYTKREMFFEKKKYYEKFHGVLKMIRTEIFWNIVNWYIALHGVQNDDLYECWLLKTDKNDSIYYTMKLYDSGLLGSEKKNIEIFYKVLKIHCSI